MGFYHRLRNVLNYRTALTFAEVVLDSHFTPVWWGLSLAAACCAAMYCAALGQHLPGLLCQAQL